MNEVERLQQENEALREQLAQAHSKVADHASQIAALQEQIKLHLQHRFSASSEKVSVDQLGLFNEAEALVAEDEASAADTDITVKSHQRTRKPRVSIPKDYPREEIIYDLPDDEKICPHDGHELKMVGSDDHEQLDIIPAQVKVLRHKRLKYACPCCDQHIVTAKKPKQAIEKSIASAGLLAYIATQKYCDALPLYRQSEIFKRAGIELDRTNLANWMVRMGELVKPLIQVLTEHLQRQPILHLDETALQVLDEPGKPAQSKSYLWLMANVSEHPVMVFNYAPTRSQSVPEKLLTPSIQAIMVDGYEGYQSACTANNIVRLGCWAHARRKFIGAQKTQPKGKTGKADQGITYIRKLYGIEKRIKDKPPDERFKIRQQEAKPIIKQLEKWMDKSLLTVTPTSAIGKALSYLKNQWPRLVGYLGDDRYPIDNNAAERAIRPFTIGRKNWMFAKSQAGAVASANLYSLIETAKANGVNPYEYLRYVFTELPSVSSDESLDMLLPWNFKLG